MELSKDFEVPQVRMRGEDDPSSQLAEDAPDSPD